MRVVIQRVHAARCVVEGQVTGAIGRGLLVFLGVCHEDTEDALPWLINRIARLRVFEDDAGRMNRSVQDIDGNVLVISQFTLYGNVRRGARPSFNRSAKPDLAEPLYEAFKARLSEALGKPVPSGVFGAHMDITADNDGPVTILIDTEQRDG